jgi:DNA-binding transcriptional regulator YiaG
MPTSILYLPLKVPVRFDLVQPLANWLDDDESQVGFEKSSSSFSSSGGGGGGGDDAPAMVVPKPTYTSVQCRSELLRIAALRNCMSEHLQDSHKSALEDGDMLRDCQDYHATLLEFEKRGFPTGGDNTENGIALTWRGAFGTKPPETHHTLLWDRACTLWNIAALKSASAALLLNCRSNDQTQTTKEEFKSAISHLQQSASHLSLCRQLMEFSQEEYVSTVDLSKPMLQLWEKIMLAQAQTLIYKMANLGDSAVRNHTTLAYLIQGAAPFYNEALKIAQDPRLQSEVPTPCTEWAAHCKAQSLVCQARAYFHMSIELRLSKSAHGKEIARLHQTISTVNEVLNFCQSSQVLREAKRIFNNSTMTPMAEAAATIQPEAEGLKRLAADRLTAAELDNQSIYLEDIPNPDQLQEIRALTMVKMDLPLPAAMLIPRANLFAWDT